ncbi:hypothetical protein CDL15_Pgr022918 [Punica granatum]|uniref:Uncharacterized protein n=1 Tax=Punica granatum TaxID=22663 RepID=A0A218X4A0_PUNGR|nr:hypothetical protein CDL15_Pgr022918 [Punica granatum]PKI35783.1 hypothetical protein CRG98_043818 [Punica granatum]
MIDSGGGIDLIIFFVPLLFILVPIIFALESFSLLPLYCLIFISMSSSPCCLHFCTSYPWPLHAIASSPSLAFTETSTRAPFSVSIGPLILTQLNPPLPPFPHSNWGWSARR